MSSLLQSPEWQSLNALMLSDGTRHLRDLFAEQPERFNAFSRCEMDILFDFSRQRVTQPVLEGLLKLAEARGLRAKIKAMFNGEIINTTEQRAVLHTALRASSDRSITVNGRNVTHEVQANLQRMQSFVEDVHSGRKRGSTGKVFTDIVNIGIGGSDLGIVMVTEALARYRQPSIKLHCVSNIDGSQLADVLDKVDAASTLFVVCSKTFSTQETLSNARIARQWLVDRLGSEAVSGHFVAVSTNDKAMDAFQIAPESRFTLWDWVGGRYSLWSAIGLSVALTIGMANFRLLLNGARIMDEHFLTAPFENNYPVLMGMLGIWNRNFLGLDSLCVLPYDQRLHRFPAYLQQLDMESNGKRVTHSGEPVECDTGAVLWGEPGSNAQHSFFQLLHQGTARAALDFIAPVNASSDYQGQQNLALANCLGQAQAFALGYNEQEVQEELQSRGMDTATIARLKPHKLHPGNHPSSILLFPRLDPVTLGKLIAMYEHKVFVQSVIWDINAFDQWGVELGKKVADSLVSAVEKPETGPVNLQGVLSHIRKWRK
jgi:glucose-6-phosphate isomerase